jgi:hypothetical protein
MMALRESVSGSPAGEPFLTGAAPAPPVALACSFSTWQPPFLAVLLAMLAATAFAAPPPPPGGHLRIHYGGNNRTGYPALNQPTAVGPAHEQVAVALAVEITPNPFRAMIRFRFSTRPGERARVRIFTAAGSEVRDLAGVGAVGLQQIAWDGRDRRGRAVPTGIYFYRVDAGSRSARGKVIHVR